MVSGSPERPTFIPGAGAGGGLAHVGIRKQMPLISPEGWSPKYNILTSVLTSTGAAGPTKPLRLPESFQVTELTVQVAGRKSGLRPLAAARGRTGKRRGRTQTQAPLPSPRPLRRPLRAGAGHEPRMPCGGSGHTPEGKRKQKAKATGAPRPAVAGGLGEEAPIARPGPGRVFPTSA